MNSFALALLLLVSSSGAVRAQTVPVKSDVEKDGLAGRVKYVELGRVEYLLKDGASVESVRYLVRKRAYDERGNMTEEVTYDQGGSPAARNVYTYDEAGRSTGFEEYSRLVDVKLSKPRRHVYTLDGAGRMVEYTVHESDGSLASRFTYAYDSAGNKTEEAFYSWNGQRTGRLVYTYDAGGRLLTQTSYKADNAVSWKQVHVYDAEGRKTETAQYQGDKLRYRLFHKYDGKGRLKESETREFNAVPNLHVTHAPEPGRVVYTYDDEKMTKEVAAYDARGALKSRLVYAADEKGNDAGVTELNADGSVKSREIHWFDKNVLAGTLSGVPTAELVYDAQGNWTRRTFFLKPAGAERAEPYWAEVRTIVYY